MTRDPAALLALASSVARDAGKLLLAHTDRQGLDVATKTSATDPVSAADRASEQLIGERLLAERPDDGILGEEDALNRRGTTGIVWVVDPLDGTVNFLYGIPAWCVSIGVRDEHGPLAAVVHDPNRGETFTAVRGGGARCNATALAVRTPDDLSVALVATGFAYAAEVRQAQGRWVADLLPRVRDVRRVGAAALDLAWLAAGRFDGFYEYGLREWDRAAGELLVREAGGVTTLATVTAGAERGPCLVAGAPAVHDALLTWLAARPDAVLG